MASDLGVCWSATRIRCESLTLRTISAERMPLDADIPGYSEIIPELVVEVTSPSDSLREVREKALMWLNYGVPLVWVAHPNTRTVDVYHADGTVLTLTGKRHARRR